MGMIANYGLSIPFKLIRIWCISIPATFVETCIVKPIARVELYSLLRKLPVPLGRIGLCTVC